MHTTMTIAMTMATTMTQTTTLTAITIIIVSVHQLTVDIINQSVNQSIKRRDL